MTTRFADHLLEGNHAGRPAATAVPGGTLYSCTDHNLIYQSDGATWSTWATLGAAEIPFIGCEANRTTTQTITTATVTPVQFNGTDEWDTSGIHDPASNNTRFTIPSGLDGIWEFDLSAEFTFNSTGHRMCLFRLNGSNLPVRKGWDRRAAVTDGSNPTDVTTTVKLNLVATDYVEGCVYHTRGADLTIVEARMTATYHGAP